MKIKYLTEIHLIGISLMPNESNQDDISRQDYGSLWQTFEASEFYDMIPNKIGNEILAVYHSYDHDFEGSFKYFVGCKVVKGTVLPEGLESFKIPAGNYAMFAVMGEIPECTAAAWRSIGDAHLNRALTVDFEVYDERSADRDHAEIDIYLAINE